jgi:hypothetical protein
MEELSSTSPGIASPTAAPPTEPPVVLDPIVMQFLLSDRYRAAHEALVKEFGLTPEEVVLIGDLDRLVMAGELSVEGYLIALEDEMTRFSEAERDRLYGRLLAERFLPLGDRLKPSALDVARSEGLALPSTEHYRIYSKPLTYSGAATEVAASAGFSVMGGPMRERLRDLVMSKVKNVRVDMQIRDVMTRGVDFGGMGLDAATADRAIAAMNDILSRANVMSEDEYASWLSAEARRKAEPAVEAPVASSEPVDPEIAAIRARMGTAPALSTELDKAIDATILTLGYKPTDEYMMRRLRNVVSSRLRNVRSRMDLKQLLMRDTKVGGMGIDAEKAELVAGQVEEAYAKHHDVIAEEEKHKIDTQLEEQKRKIEERRKREMEEHAKWFEDKIRARKAGETKQSQAVEDMRRVFGGMTSPVKAPAHPVDAKEHRMETDKFGPLIAVTPTVPKVSAASVASSSAPAPSRPTPLQPAPVPAQVKVSPATIQLAQAQTNTRPSVDGVTYGGPKLVGLVGELAKLSVAEFRRLSKQPEDAATKIRQKIETLAMESFDKKVEGIRAFQESPLQAAYLSLVGESFRSMKPVAMLADEKRKSGADTLSPDEIAAIVRLNSALHF